MRTPDSDRCVNWRCREELPIFGRLLCPSCALAFRFGLGISGAAIAVFAGVIGAAVKAWLQWR